MGFWFRDTKPWPPAWMSMRGRLVMSNLNMGRGWSMDMLLAVVCFGEDVCVGKS